MKDVSDYFESLEPTGPIEIRGAWEPDTSPIALGSFPITFAPLAERVCGIDLYPRVFRFMADATCSGGSVEFAPTGMMRRERSAWWRWLGYYAIGVPVGWLRTVVERR